VLNNNSLVECYIRNKTAYFKEMENILIAIYFVIY